MGVYDCSADDYSARLASLEGSFALSFGRFLIPVLCLSGLGMGCL